MPVNWQQEIIRAGYKKLAEKFHPDHDGKACDMIALNGARDELLSWLGVVGVIKEPTQNPLPRRERVRVEPVSMAPQPVATIPLAEALFGPGASELFSQGFTTIQEFTKTLKQFKRAQRRRR